MSLWAGFAEIEITPPVGIELAGYIARDGAATSVHDPLYARALVIADGAARAALITCDTLGLHLRDVEQVRQAIAARTTIPAAQILITCSHTHAGPATLFLQDCGEIDEAYMAVLRQKLATVAEQAAAQVQPARWAVGRGTVTTGIHNRRQPGDITDPELLVVRVDNQQGEPLGVLLNLACHPTCLTGENRLISAEYCGYAVEQIRQSIGVPALFVTGAIGDVGPVARGWPVLTEIGQAVAEEALRVHAALTPTPWQGLQGLRQSLTLPLSTLPNEADLATELVNWQNVAQTQTPEAAPEETPETTLPLHPKIPIAMQHWVERTLAALKSAVPPNQVTTEVQALRVGQLMLVSAPGELFVELGLAVKAAVAEPFACLLCGFGNDNIGYIPTRRAYPVGGYEVADAYKYYGYPAALAPEAGEIYVATASALLRALSADH